MKSVAVLRSEMLCNLYLIIRRLVNLFGQGHGLRRADGRAGGVTRRTDGRQATVERSKIVACLLNIRWQTKTFYCTAPRQHAVCCGPVCVCVETFEYN